LRWETVNHRHHAAALAATLSIQQVWIWRWAYSVLDPFADDANVCTNSENQVGAFEPGHLGEAQACLHGDQHEGMITSARPGTLIRRSEQGIDFGTRQEMHQGAGKTLAGYGEYPLDLRGMRWCLERRVAKEGVNRR